MTVQEVKINVTLRLQNVWSGPFAERFFKSQAQLLCKYSRE